MPAKKSDYAEYLRSPHWIKVKKRIRKQRGNKCEGCGLGIFLHVHHGSYANVGRELDEELFLVCKNCHKKIHDGFVRPKRKPNKALMRRTLKVLGIHKKRWKQQKRKVKKAKTPKKPMLYADDQCRKCKGELHWKSSKLTSKRLKRAYHFCKWLRCKSCKTFYMVEKYKVMQGDNCNCERTRKQAQAKPVIKRNTEPLKSYLREV